MYPEVRGDAAQSGVTTHRFEKDVGGVMVVVELAGGRSETL